VVENTKEKARVSLRIRFKGEEGNQIDTQNHSFVRIVSSSIETLRDTILDTDPPWKTTHRSHLSVVISIKRQLFDKQ
jgi:hypothetical protein